MNSREAWDNFWNHPDAKDTTLTVILDGVTYEYTKDDFEKASEVFTITGSIEQEDGSRI